MNRKRADIIAVLQTGGEMTEGYRGEKVITLALAVTATLLTGCSRWPGFAAKTEDYGLASGRVQVRVVDDQGQPVEGATVFVSSTSWNAYEGLTDENGVYSCTMKNIYPPIGGSVRKQGYYKTQGDFWTGDFGVLPTERLEITLKRIINPVPLEKREVRLLFPVLGEPVGFDFAAGDWVDPYGKGKLADVFITGTFERDDKQSTFSYVAMLSAVSRHDGFVPFQVVRRSGDMPARSALQAPQLAQESGYKRKISAHLKRLGGRRGWDDSYYSGVDYYFRVRTVMDQNQEVESANVGWFFRGIRMTRNDKFDPANPATRLRITMCYYWNPDPTSRSLEPKEIADMQWKY